MNMATPNPRYQHRPGLERTSPFTLQSDSSAKALGRKKNITVDFDGDITAKEEFLVYVLRRIPEGDDGLVVRDLPANYGSPATQTWDLVLASPDFDGQPPTAGLFTDHR